MATARELVWVFDTSSVIAVRRLPNVDKPAVFAGLTNLVIASRLVYPPEVVEELKRHADPDAPDQQYLWAKLNEAVATAKGKCFFDDVKVVLAIVPTVLDPNKDAGAEEADPYVLTVATRLQQEGFDARIVTEETKDTPQKMSISTAAGILGIPSVPLKALLAFEKIP